MYEMLPFLGHLPSNAFSGFTDNFTVPTTPTPPFDIGGSGGGIYRIERSSSDDNLTDGNSSSNIT
jgi:hypothetical protein